MDNKNYQDHFFFKAKTLGYRSRSALKLIELNKKFKFLKNGLNILDVGSYPGGWCQVIQKKNNKGKILGIDLKKIDQIKGIKLIEGDFLDTNSKKKINYDKIENGYKKEGRRSKFYSKYKNENGENIIKYFGSEKRKEIWDEEIKKDKNGV